VRIKLPEFAPKLVPLQNVAAEGDNADRIFPDLCHDSRENLFEFDLIAGCNEVQGIVSVLMTACVIFPLQIITSLLCNLSSIFTGL
jgi:hypothetical protein